MENLTINENSQGVLKDGRKFLIVKIHNLVVNEEGRVLDGSVGVLIESEYISCNVSNLAKNIDYECRDGYRRIDIC